MAHTRIEKSLMFVRDQAKRIAAVKRDDLSAWAYYREIRNEINTNMKRSKPEY